MFERGEAGSVELRLSQQEQLLVAGLVEELRAMLKGEPGDESLRRLFPPAYEEAGDEQAYRELAGDDLLRGRLEALAVVERTVGQKRLTADEADAWLRALNDLRLVLGTRLDVQEDTFLDDLRARVVGACRLRLPLVAAGTARRGADGLGRA
jgi:hypothetical protein